MPKIIIVEDDPMIAEIYLKKFQEAGYDTEQAESGDQVLMKAKKEKVDIVLLDLMMPKMSGFDVIKNLRGGGQYDKNIRIIVFSNLSQPEDREKALKLGADGFITKSEYTPTSLVGEVTRILEESNQEKMNLARMEENTLQGEVSNEEESSKPKILIIEDEEVFIEMFGEKLKQEGFQVVSARNGAWGLKEALAHDFDLYIIDMVMPAMTGEEIIDRLKLEEKTKNVPIIVLSASVDEQLAKQVIDKGVDGFFVKTQIIPSELAKEVKNVLDHKSS